jgi:hypothetical protein
MEKRQLKSLWFCLDNQDGTFIFEHQFLNAELIFETQTEDQAWDILEGMSKAGKLTKTELMKVNHKTRFPFGKRFRGTPIGAINKNYLIYAYQNFSLSKRFKKYIETYLL